MSQGAAAAGGKPRKTRKTRSVRQSVDDADELGAAVTMLARVPDQVAGAGQHREARARARRRRRRLKIAAVAAVLAIIAAAGTLVVLALTTHPAATHPRKRPAPTATHTGIVIGHLEACFGVPPRNGQLPDTPGTVLAVRGRLTSKPNGPGSWRLVFPKGPAVAISEHITNNYDQTFRFALPPGHYVLEGRYDGSTDAVPGTFAQVTVTAAKTARVDLPDLCS